MKAQKEQKQLQVMEQDRLAEVFSQELANPFLQTLQKETLKNYKSAKRHNDKHRMEKYKQDNFQLYCVDNNMLNVKVGQEYGGWKIEKNGLKDVKIPNFELNMEKENVKYPRQIDKFEKEIPDNVYSKIHDIDKKFEGHKISYYVSELNRPDPYLLVQIDKKKEYTFLVGRWE